MTTWAIKDWATLFQKGDLRPGRVLTWAYVPIPIRLNSEGYKRLAKTSRGREAFMVFIALCELAANLPTRGVLADERGPLSTESISIKISVPERVIEAATELLRSDQIGWLVPWENSAESRIESADPRKNGALPPPSPSGITWNPPPPPPERADAAAGSDPESDRAGAYAALTAEPWPNVGEPKARALIGKVSVGAILAAVQRGRTKNAAGEKIGGGLVARWIEDGTAERWFQADRTKRRKAMRTKWDRTPSEAQVVWLGRYIDEKPALAGASAAQVSLSDEFIDWLEEAVKRPA